MDTGEQVLRFLSETVGARPVGSPANRQALSHLCALAEQSGFYTHELPFECLSWEYGPSSLRTGGASLPIYPGPYSPPLWGDYRVVRVSSVEELRETEFRAALLVMHGALAAEPLMPTDFPFYFPDKHREIIDLLHAGAPAGILAVTGKHPLCGLSPFPLFEDGALGIPNAYAPAEHLEHLAAAESKAETTEVRLVSQASPTGGKQAVFHKRKEAAGRRILVCAHMDTKHETPGALDNAAGVAVMMAVMDRLQLDSSVAGVEFVPFNGEEYFGVSGQLAYLAYLNGTRPPAGRQAEQRPVDLVINIDGVGLRGSTTALSSYNAPEPDILELPGGGGHLSQGEAWVAGDHSMFAFGGTPCLALTSSTIMTDGIKLTHTSADTSDQIDIELLEVTADATAALVRWYAE